MAVMRSFDSRDESMKAESCACAATAQNASISPFCRPCCSRTSSVEMHGPERIHAFAWLAALAMQLTASAVFLSRTRFAKSSRDFSLLCASSLGTCRALLRPRTPASCIPTLASALLSRAGSDISSSASGSRLCRASARRPSNAGQARSCGVVSAAGWHRELTLLRSRFGGSLRMTSQISSSSWRSRVTVSGIRIACFSPGTPAMVNLVCLSSERGLSPASGPSSIRVGNGSWCRWATSWLSRDTSRGSSAVIRGSLRCAWW
mmetsp:Transcript_7861/g.21083  ORF Transcript_7861/g.21083 Transcript_7861/m.21083 type:complete len:262 (+) Transcript_7861:2261-3046(+)